MPYYIIKKLVLWSKDYQTTDPDKIKSFSKSLLLNPGDILLLHDKTQSSVIASEVLLQNIQSSGLKTLTLSESLED